MFNIQGRFHHRGKSLSAEIRGDIIDSVLEAGGDSTNGYFPGKWEDIGTKHKVYGKTGNPSKLGHGELNLIKAMKTQNPSVSYKVIKENLLQHGNLQTGTSTTAIGLAVRSSMLQGKIAVRAFSTSF